MSCRVSSPFWATWEFKTFHIKPDSRKCRAQHCIIFTQLTSQKQYRSFGHRNRWNMADPVSVTAVFVGDPGSVSLSGLSTQRNVQSSTTDTGTIKRTEKQDNTLPQIFPLQNNEVTPARLWRHHADKQCWTTPFLFSFLLLHHLHCTLSGAATGQTQRHSGKQHNCKKLSVFKSHTF